MKNKGNQSGEFYKKGFRILIYFCQDFVAQI